MYVLMNIAEYLNEIDETLSDSNKYKQIKKNPTEDFKKKLNRYMKEKNSIGSIKSDKLTREYDLGYCFGNVKTHKLGNKLRPIISQIPTPTWNVAKRLCAILTLYKPNTYCQQSAPDFLDILKTHFATVKLMSLYVEFLFTNVPVGRTIDCIIDRVFHNSTTPTDIQEDVLRGLLECCTREGPFISPRRKKYCQTDGVA